MVNLTKYDYFFYMQIIFKTYYVYFELVSNKITRNR